MEDRHEDQGVEDRGARDSDPEALDLKNPHISPTWSQLVEPWNPRRRMSVRWWKERKVMECMISQVRERSVGKSKKQNMESSALTDEERQFLREEKEEESRLRAKSAVRRKLLTIGADHLTTLTYRENMQDLAKAEQDLKKFVALVREEIEHFDYVAVWERQERGAIHWHLGVVGRQDVYMLRRCWRKVVGEGNIDVRGPRGRGNQYAGLARYISKYITKGQAERRKYQHRYRASLGIEEPKETYQLGARSLESAIEMAKDLILSLLGPISTVQFIGGGLYDWAFVAGYG